MDRRGQPQRAVFVFFPDDATVRIADITAT
jgi:hypothetical protein